MRFVPALAGLAMGALALVADPRPRDARHTSDAHADPPRRGARRCVKYRQAPIPRDGGVRMTLANRCRFEVACELRWEVRCDGVTTPSASHLVLAVDETSSVTASAESCAGDWEVAEIRWSCERP
jgi:hypothetical protein